MTATAAKAVIDFIEEQKLMDNCTETGGYLRGSLEELKDKHEIIGDVRGMGLMQAIELVEDRKTKNAGHRRRPRNCWKPRASTACWSARAGSTAT